MQNLKPMLLIKAKIIKTLALTAVTAISGSLFLRAETGIALPYPEGYLEWAHVKKETMAAQDPALKSSISMTSAVSVVWGTFSPRSSAGAAAMSRSLKRSRR